MRKVVFLVRTVASRVHCERGPAFDLRNLCVLPLVGHIHLLAKSANSDDQQTQYAVFHALVKRPVCLGLSVVHRHM